jgi:hypothetical protein
MTCDTCGKDYYGLLKMYLEHLDWIDELRRELLERAEAHEDAEARCRAKDFGGPDPNRLYQEKLVLSKWIDALKRELLERAEAHEEALRCLPLYEEDEGEYAEYREYTDYERRLLGVDK